MTVKDLRDYKNNLYSALSRDLDAFEKNFLLVAGAILAFSVTFIKEIVKINEASCLYILFISWFLIAIAIGLIMWAFLSSVDASNSLWKFADDYLSEINKQDDNIELTPQEIKNYNERKNAIFYNSKTSLRRKRYAAVITFLTGTIFFSTFVGINLLNENNKSKLLGDEFNKVIKLKNDSIKITLSDSSIILNLYNGYQKESRKERRKEGCKERCEEVR